jgi:anti-anti-sigma regulatory factor
VRSIARRPAVGVAVRAAARTPRTGVTAGHPQGLEAHIVGDRLTLSGRLDGRGASVLHDAVSSLLRTGQSSWTLEATQLVVVDHSGLRALVGCYQRALEHGCRVTVHGASPGLRHALERLRLDVHLLPPDDGRPTRGPVGARRTVTST